jgi:NAD(P)-dependent dehydrogenase (short-subunit alcohol dehydrogenase family)
MENSVALVTGANKGIGKEIARQLAAVGLLVYVGSRDAARGERAVEEIGGHARLLVLDVADAASIADAARQAGALDILVNNAGISGDGETADREDVGTFRRVYETNSSASSR